ncbi:sensor histidine kinase [Rhizobium mongolense]|uniref:histidine kinase n=1 Tax=Rhizobium mongolense USDA 1844 TaxID=1079460 RepID=A0A559TIY5_9HYPH|nr:sensor histidine kinase [Rhizobium mongolense]TVZ74578.1 two-component system sensor histidine kinase TctE [Rhizobium mongolense USDA 1844]
MAGGIARIRRSLRVQLFSWVVLTLAGAICVNLYLSFRSATAASRLVADRTLLASARVIAEAVHVDDSGSVEVEIPPAALEMFDTGFGDQVFYRVTTPWGNLLSGYPDLPTPSVATKGEDLIFHDHSIRALKLEHPVVGLGGDGTIAVTVGVTHGSQYAIRRQLWLSDFVNQLALVLLAGVVTIIGLQRGLSPILRLRDAVRQRDRDRLDPFPPSMVQTELQPLVRALNDHMESVQRQMAAQQRFVANAAHQLRTPLALIATQAAVAAREVDIRQRDEALQALQKSTRQVTRLAGQLLALSRAEPGNFLPRTEHIDLATLARCVLENLAEEALKRNIDLGFDDGGPANVTGDATMLGELVVNLVDNALRYTPPGGSVTVSVKSLQNMAILMVEDTGPGIAESERTQVFERFYRVMDTGAEGSGLGLAIVQEVVDGAGGTIELRDGKDGGLLVLVTLPLRE